MAGERFSTSHPQNLGVWSLLAQTFITSLSRVTLADAVDQQVTEIMRNFSRLLGPKSRTKLLAYVIAFLLFHGMCHECGISCFFALEYRQEFCDYSVDPSRSQDL